MSNIKKVFLLIGTLFLAFIVWGLVFNNGGVLKTGYNAVTTPINNTWNKITGNSDPSANLLPSWTTTQVDPSGNLNDQTNGFK